MALKTGNQPFIKVTLHPNTSLAGKMGPGQREGCSQNTTSDSLVLHPQPKSSKSVFCFLQHF